MFPARCAASIASAPCRSTASDPLGLYKMERGAGRRNQVIVHPETMELPNFVLLPADLPAEGSVRRRSQHSTTNAYGIRDYYWGDSLNRISWKATARHRRLMVKEFEVEPANNIWVLADMERRANAGPAGRDVEETVVRVAASICRRYSEGRLPRRPHGPRRRALRPRRGARLRPPDAHPGRACRDSCPGKPPPAGDDRRPPYAGRPLHLRGAHHRLARRRVARRRPPTSCSGTPG